MTYDEPGTHTYVLCEKEGNLGGVTYDKKSYQIEAKVTDEGKGKLEVDFFVVGSDSKNLEFVNNYDPSADPAAKTGDETKMMFYMLTATLALIGAVLTLLRKENA